MATPSTSSTAPRSSTARSSPSATLSTRDGRPTNAIFGTLKMVEKLLRERDPSTSPWSSTCPAPPSGTRRSRPTRPTAPRRPPTLWPRSAPPRRSCAPWACPWWSSRASRPTTASPRSPRGPWTQGMEVVIVTADKDLFQLVRPGVRILHTKKEDALLDEKGVEEVFGVPPERVVDVLALWGDPTDNIPGVPGIGEKGAKELVEQYGDLESVLAHAGGGHAEGLPGGTGTARRRGEVLPRAGYRSAGRAPRRRSPATSTGRLPTGRRCRRCTPAGSSAPSRRRRRRGRQKLGAEAVAPGRGCHGRAAGAARPWALTWDGDSAWVSDGERVWRRRWRDLCGAGLSSRAAMRLRPEGPPPPDRRGDRSCSRRCLDASVAGYLIDPSGAVPSLARALRRISSARRPRPGDRAAEALALARHQGAPGIQARSPRAWPRSPGSGVAPHRRSWRAWRPWASAWTCPTSRTSARELESALKSLEKQIHEAAGLAFNVASPKQLGRGPLREAEPPRPEEDEQDQVLLHRQRGPREPAGGPPRGAPGARVPAPQQAQGHLRGPAPGLGGPRTRAASTPGSTRPWPPRGASPPPTPTCRTSP